MGLMGSQSAWAAAVSALLGMLLGAVTDVLSPLRRKIPVLTDLVFCIGMVWIWLEIGFGICGGDIKAVFFLAAVLGALGWRSWVSPVTRPVFAGFWHLIGGWIALICNPAKYLWKKIKKFRKKLFPTGEKWVTISKDKMPK